MSETATPTPQQTEAEKALQKAEKSMRFAEMAVSVFLGLCVLSIVIFSPLTKDIMGQGNYLATLVFTLGVYSLPTVTVLGIFRFIRARDEVNQLKADQRQGS